MAGLLGFWNWSQSVPFEWGKCDCVLWGAAYVEAKTGTHPAPHMVGAYSTKFGARRLIMRAGGFEALLSSFMSDYSDGSDVGLFQIRKTKLVGVSGSNGVAFKTDTGLMVSREAELIKGWSL